MCAMETDARDCLCAQLKLSCTFCMYGIITSVVHTSQAYRRSTTYRSDNLSVTAVRPSSPALQEIVTIARHDVHLWPAGHTTLLRRRNNVVRPVGTSRKWTKQLSGSLCHTMCHTTPQLQNMMSISDPPGTRRCCDARRNNVVRAVGTSRKWTQQLSGSLCHTMDTFSVRSFMRSLSPAGPVLFTVVPRVTYRTSISFLFFFFRAFRRLCSIHTMMNTSTIRAITTPSIMCSTPWSVYEDPVRKTNKVTRRYTDKVYNRHPPEHTTLLRRWIIDVDSTSQQRRVSSGMLVCFTHPHWAHDVVATFN